MRGLRERPRWRGEGRWDPDGEMLVAGLKRAGEQEWHVARQPLPDNEPRALGSLIMQTLVLYVVLVGGLAFLLRRITRPLAALTKRVEQFAETRAVEGQVEPTGPEDMRRLITAHNAMEGRIAALIDEKDVMLGAIGHDLKTPLAALRVRIESVEDEAERARMAATIEDITRSLDDILSLARVGRPTDPLERTDLAALAASLVEEYEDMCEPVEVGETQRVAVPLRATWMRRALRNLIGNGLRYGEAARVSVLREDGHAIVRIEDRGPGIAEGEIAGMLEPFVRGEASRSRETGGAGLGLTLARAIAELLGGTLSLANRRGEGGEVAGLVAELRLPLP
jgi:signal transduction histidine kinase